MTSTNFAPQDVAALVEQAGVWLSFQQSALRQHLRPLSPHETALARAMGVSHPDQVRVARLPHLPAPEHPALAQATSALGLFTPAMAAIAAGYLVLLRESHATDRLLAHELRLVHHFENIGSLEGYLRHYIAEVFENGYGRTPMELDAERCAAAIAL